MAENVCLYTGQHVIVQLGVARTASTQQSMILLLCMFLANSVHDLEDKQEYHLFYGIKTPRLAPHRYLVVKTHNPDHWRIWKKRANNTMLFMTNRQGSVIAPGLREEACYVQRYEEMIDETLFVLRDYQRIFNLSETDYHHLRAYMKHWQIIRKCCGVQASADWLIHLHAADGKHQSELRYVRHRVEDLDYPDCELYNLTQVEQNLELTDIRQRVSTLGTRFQDSMDFLYTGPGFCEQQNAAIRNKHLGINRDHTGKLLHYTPARLK